MSKKKQKKTNLKSAILLLLLMALLLITSSYAWFTANQTVTISTLQVNVKASNGLQISADATNWKTILDKQDLVTAAATYDTLINQLPEQNLEPVSTTGNVTDGKMDMFYGVAEADGTGVYKLTATKQTEATGTTGKYIAFDLFLKVDNDTTIYMTPNSNVKMVGDSDKGLQNAARVGFVTEGHATVDAEPGTIRTLSSNTAADIWEPNYDVHTASAVAAARDTYGLTTTTTGGTKLDYYGIKAAIATGDNITMQQLNTSTASPSDTYFSKVKTKWATTANNTATPEFKQLSAGVTKIRVYMWVEGQDVDCENGASGSDITFDLQFTATNPQP